MGWPAPEGFVEELRLCLLVSGEVESSELSVQLCSRGGSVIAEVRGPREPLDTMQQASLEGKQVQSYTVGMTWRSVESSSSPSQDLKSVEKQLLVSAGRLISETMESRCGERWRHEINNLSSVLGAQQKESARMEETIRSLQRPEAFG